MTSLSLKMSYAAAWVSLHFYPTNSSQTINTLPQCPVAALVTPSDTFKNHSGSIFFFGRQLNFLFIGGSTTQLPLVSQARKPENQSRPGCACCIQAYKLNWPAGLMSYASHDPGDENHVDLRRTAEKRCVDCVVL